MSLLFSIKPILFLHYLLVLKTEEQDKSILCMCVYILCICIEYVLDFVNKTVLRRVGIWVYTDTVVWLCVYCEGWFWLLKYSWFEYLIQYSCYDCACQFSLNNVCLTNGKCKVLCNFVWPAYYFVQQT